MDFGDYQYEARKTAIYPQGFYPDGYRMLYPALGLAGECGEVAENVKKMVRDDGGILTPERKSKLMKEMGDVLWYLANLAEDCGFELGTVAEVNIHKLRERKRQNTLQGSGDDR